MGLLDEDEVSKTLMGSLGFEINIQEPPPPFEHQESNAQEQEIPSGEIEMSEVERRLAKAQLYKQFVSGSIFSGEGPIVEEVSKEFQKFAMQQLQVLMGIGVKDNPVQEIFTEQEIIALKSLSAMILKNPKVLTPIKANPTVKSNPSQKPVAESFISKPQLKVRQVPEEVPQKPTLKKTIIKHTFSGNPKTPSDGAVIEEGGSKFRVKHANMSSVDEFGQKNGVKLRNINNGESVILDNGLQIYKDNGQYFKVLKTLIVEKTDVSGRIPFPSNEQMAQISLSSATAAASRLEANKLPLVSELLKRSYS